VLDPLQALPDEMAIGDGPMLALSAATRGIGFPARDQRLERYAERTGRDVSNHRWCEIVAL
jgi:aminoglycoside phosphotransferase (APT) family kinase protein